MKQFTFENLSQGQEEFSVAIAQLILWANENKIKLRLKDAYRDPRVHGSWGEKIAYGGARSVHKVSLAVDLYTPNYEDYKLLHNQWTKLGGAPRIENDMNHFSFLFEDTW